MLNWFNMSDVARGPQRVFGIEIYGFRSLGGRFARVTEELHSQRFDAVYRMAETLKTEMVAAAPKFYGTLREKIYYEMDGSGDEETATFYVDDPASKYSDWVRFGRGPVRPVYAPALVYPTDPGHESWVRSQYSAPSRKITDFVAIAYQKLDPEIEQEVRRLATRVQIAWG